MVLFINLFSFAILTAANPVIIDSIIYAVDVKEKVVREQALKGTIIDHKIDDFVYALTNRYLYKVDCEHPAVHERIPLPLRFNHLITGLNNIFLVGANEIITIDKSNLAFKTGIGIEYGDYQPMLLVENTTSAEGGSLMHLISHSGEKSVIKVFDLQSGKLIKKMTVDRVTVHFYDKHRKVLITLDIKKRISVYDIHLNKKNMINLGFEIKWFYSCENGFMVINEHGIFFINHAGKLIDFQPITSCGQVPTGRLVHLIENGIVSMDTLTLRPRAYCKNDNNIVRLLQIGQDYPNYTVGLDADHNLHIINCKTMEMSPLHKTRPIPKKEQLPPVILHSDSLWYLQLGAFVNYGNAFEMYNGIRQNNFPAFIDSSDLYRIKLGGFQDKTSAIEFIDKTELNGWFLFQEKISQNETIEFMIGMDRYILEQGVIKRRAQ